MIFYYSKRIVARAIGRRVVTVECKKCRAVYRYLLVRGAMETASAPLGNGVDAARSRAQTLAEEKLASRLTEGVDPVPCPDCGWYQAKMVTEIRRRRSTWVLKAMLSVGAMMVLVALITGEIETRGFRDGFDRMSGEANLKTGLACTSIIIGPVAVWVLGRFCRRRIQPNDPNMDLSIETNSAPVSARVGPDGRNDVPIESDPDEINVPGQIGYDRGKDRRFPGGWMTVELSTAVSPPTCAVCLDFCSTFTLFGRSLKVPVAICRSCRVRMWRKNILIGTGLFLLLVIIDLAILNAMPHREQTEKAWPIAIATIAVEVLSMMAIVRWTQPVDIREASIERNTAQVRFRCRPFAEAFFALNRREAWLTLDQFCTALSTAQKNTGGNPPVDGSVFPHQI